MKTRILRVSILSLGLAVTGLLIQAGRMQGRQAESPIDPASPESLTTFADAGSNSAPTEVATNSTAQSIATNQLPSLLAQPITPTGVKLSRGANDIARFAQGGIGEDVMLAYVANANGKFNLGSDQIVYLNDIGVSGDVVKAMIQRDAALDLQAQAYAASQAAQTTPPFTNAPPAVDETPYSQPDDTAMAPPYDSSTPLPVDDSQYFYSSLAPFGSWIYVAGYGVCWQPTVCVGNQGWRPYCDRGRWVYTNCGWYWRSDYSWGWAAFHYGRWFENPRCGWVWCPDKVWSPAWVSWRASGDHCGWAPLPPSAKYVPGSGFVYANRRVHAGFEFGLKAHQYTFVPIARLSDYAPARYAVASWDAERISKETKVITDVREQNHRVVAAGVDPKQVSALAHTEIRQVEIHDLPRNGLKMEQSDRMTRNAGKLVINRPPLPTATTHVAGSMGEKYPAGSLVLRRNGQIGHPSTTPHTFAAYAPAQSQPVYVQHQYTPVRPNVQTTGNQGVSSVVISGHYTAAQRGGTVSAAGSSSTYQVYSTSSPYAARAEQPAAQNVPHVLPGRFTAAEHLNNSTPEWGRSSAESVSPSHTRNELFGGSEAHTHVESHSYSAPAYSAPPSSHSSSSSSQSSGGSSGHK